MWGLEPEFCKHVEDSDLTEWGVKLREKCSELFTDWYSRAAELLVQDTIAPKSYRTCDPVQIPYHALLSAGQVLEGNMHERLKYYLTGKIVIYAARNLLTFGAQYMHPTSAEGAYHKNITDYQPTLLVLLAALFVGFWRRTLLRPFLLGPKEQLTKDEREELLEELLKEDEKVLRRSRWVLYGVIVIIGAIEFVYFRISPLNWLGILLVVEAVHWFGRKAFSPTPD